MSTLVVQLFLDVSFLWLVSPVFTHCFMSYCGNFILAKEKLDFRYVLLLLRKKKICTQMSEILVLLYVCVRTNQWASVKTVDKTC